MQSTFKKEILLLWASMIFALIQSQAQIDLSFNPSTPTVDVNDVFSLTVDLTEVNGIGTQQIDYAEVRLTFDESILEVNSITVNSNGAGQLTQVLVPDNFDNSAGTIEYGAGISPTGSPIDGTLTLITVEFTAIGTGISPVSFNLTDFPPTLVALSGLDVINNTQDASVTVNGANAPPVITLDGTASVIEGGNISVPLSITDADGDNLTVTLTSASNEPTNLQSNQGAGTGGIQIEPYPFDASDFLNESGVSSAAGSYSSSLDFTPTFGDGGSDGDGNGTYTITVEVNDGVNAAVTQDLILTVNDVDQDVSATGTTRIEAESYDNQGNTGGPAVDGIGVKMQAQRDSS